MKNKIFNFLALCSALSLAVSCGETNRKVAADNGQTEDKAVVKKLTQQLSLHPDSLGLRYQLMNALAVTGAYQAALLHNDTLLTGDSLNAPVLYRRGVIQLQSGDTVAGALSLQRAASAAPMFAEPRLQLAAVYADRSDARALTVTDTLIQHAVEQNVTIQARFIRGLYYSNTNHKDQAIVQFDECIKADYTFLEAYVEKGLLLYDLKKYAEALAVFERSITVSNTFAEGYFQAGRCKEALGDKQGAKDDYEKAYALDNSLVAAKEARQRL